MAKSKLEGKRKVAAVDSGESSDDGTVAPPSKAAKVNAALAEKPAIVKGRPAVTDSDSSSEEPCPKATARAAPRQLSAAKRKQVEDSDDSSEESAPKVMPKAKTLLAKKADAEDSDDSSEESAPKVMPKAKTLLVPKAKAKGVPSKTKQEEESDDSSDELVPKAKPKAAPAKARQAENSDDSSDEPASKTKAGSKAKAEADESDSDSEFVVTVAPKRKVEEVTKAPVEDPKAEPVAKKGRPDSAAGQADLEVFVGGLAWDCIEATLRADFEECGEIENMHLPMTAEKTSKGIAFLTFKNAEGVEAALKFNGTEYGGRTLTVRLSSNKPEYLPGMSKSKGGGGQAGKGGQAAHSSRGSAGDLEVFVNGIPYDCDEAQFTKDFEECGDIKDISMPVSNGIFKGIAFITYKTKEGVEAALKYNGVEYGGRRLQVRMSSDKPNTNGNIGDRIDELTAFVSGVSFNVSEEQLRKDFGKCGSITRFVMPLNEDGKPKGVAFIQFKDKDGLDKAIAQFNDKEHGRAGRWLTVETFGARARGDHRKTANKKGKGKSKGADKIEEFTAVVAGLSASVKESALQSHFEECGEIERLSLPPSGADNTRTRLAFVQFKTKEALEKALEFNGTEYAGGLIKVRAEGTGFKGKGKGDSSKGKDEGDKLKKKKKKNNVCKFFSTPEGCQKGSDCDFEHIKKKAASQDDE